AGAAAGVRAVGVRHRREHVRLGSGECADRVGDHRARRAGLLRVAVVDGAQGRALTRADHDLASTLTSTRRGGSGRVRPSSTWPASTPNRIAMRSSDTPARATNSVIAPSVPYIGWPCAR